MAELLRYHPLVAEDLASAVKWYDKISVELGNRFGALSMFASIPLNIGLNYSDASKVTFVRLASMDSHTS
jgi:hypothetical protein